MAALQQALFADEAVVSWFWAATDTLIVVAVSADAMRPTLVHLDASAQARLADYLEALGRLSGAGPDYGRLIPQIAEQVAALGDVLLPDEMRATLAGKKRLLLCPHRTLHLFPFHALPWHEGGSARPLLTRFAVGYVPNLSSLLLPWRGARRGPVLAVGVSRFHDPRLPPLPGAEAEAAAVAAAHGVAGKLLVGATRAQFVGLPLADYRCLHLATHGSSVLAADALDDPLQSGLEFCDGPLPAWDLVELKLRAELVVLSACHSGSAPSPGAASTASGRRYPRPAGGAVRRRGRQRAGTLWPVEDATAQAILVDFHRAYAGGAAPEEALQAAVLAHLADPRRRRGLFYWAPFFVSSLGRREAPPEPVHAAPD